MFWGNVSKIQSASMMNSTIIPQTHAPKLLVHFLSIMTKLSTGVQVVLSDIIIMPHLINVLLTQPAQKDTSLIQQQDYAK